MVIRNGRSAEARKVLGDLDAELAAFGKAAGRPAAWSAADRAVLAMIADETDRLVDLSTMYADAAEPKVRIKLSTEMRLLEQSVARLLKQVKTSMPASESKRTRSARHAANARWGREAG